MWVLNPEYVGKLAAGAQVKVDLPANETSELPTGARQGFQIRQPIKLKFGIKDARMRAISGLAGMSLRYTALPGPPSYWISIPGADILPFLKQAYRFDFPMIPHT
jgi:hypothetical protein